MIFIDDTPDTLDTPPPEEEPIAAAPVEQAKPKKRAAKKKVNKPKRKAKVAKRAKGKASSSSRTGGGKGEKKSFGKSASKSKPQKARRGPKGNPPEKVLRKGDAAYGKKVAAARKAKGLRQWQLAEKMGVGQPSICNVEKGTLAAGIGMQKLIKKHLGVPMTKACEAAIEKGHKSIVKSRKK